MNGQRLKTPTINYNSFSFMERLNQLNNKLVKYRRISYRGYGRPKKSDYILIKLKDIPHYQFWEYYKFGLTPFYSKK
ncbi:MAG: hypothetical protein WC619_01985 [Patescibacteria group bacterium]